jgi:polysaccharide deacetylase family protein (PEP-CTERM system associated)
MSIDLEDWFCVYNFEGVIPRDQWASLDSRVERNTTALLDLFDRYRVKATFFVLGWVAERHPDLIREVERRGHELATHGYSHRLITKMTQTEFEQDLARSLETLARISSQRILGFRAPSFSVTEKTLWSHLIMARFGLVYDSSVYPIGMHPDYGIATAPLEPYRTDSGVLEIPMSCVEIAGKRIPCSGGGYFRLFPYPVTRKLLSMCNKQGRPVVFYLHPWEIDPQQPRVPVSRMKAFRHYNNLHRTLDRMDQLLSDFRFDTMRACFLSQTQSLPAVG